jgi:hypothetical protein
MGKRQNADPRSVDYLRGPGPWTTLVDHFYGPFSWTTPQMCMSRVPSLDMIVETQCEVLNPFTI